MPREYTANHRTDKGAFIMSQNIEENWEEYSYKVQMLIKTPKNSGTISQKEARELDADMFIYEYGSESLGDMITLYWAIDSNTDTILMSRFQVFGSPATVAANDMMALLCRNKTVDKATEITYKGLEYFLRDNPNSVALPKSKSYVISMALDAVRCAAREYYNDPNKREDKELVSNDSPMSLNAIKETIVLHQLQTVEEITQYTKAGSYDLGCIEPNSRGDSRSYYLSNILKDTLKQLEEDKLSKMEVLDTPFRDMDTAQKIAAVDKAIDDSNVRQFLIMDGGDMEILDVKENGNQIDIYIRYIGACNGCASANTSTLFAVETTLKERLDPEIRVLPI